MVIINLLTMTMEASKVLVMKNPQTSQVKQKNFEYIYYSFFSVATINHRK